MLGWIRHVALKLGMMLAFSGLVYVMTALALAHGKDFGNSVNLASGGLWIWKMALTCFSRQILLLFRDTRERPSLALSTAAVTEDKHQGAECSHRAPNQKEELLENNFRISFYCTVTANKRKKKTRLLFANVIL